METIFIIGGSGFIGKNLARYLSTNYKVYVYDKSIDIDYFSEYPSIQTYTLDLIYEQIERNIKSPDYIINLASIVTAERDISLFDKLISSNLKVLLNLYDRFKNDDTLKLFIQFGSSEEYGSKDSPFKESMREYPNSPYALVKQLTTNTAMMLHSNYGFPSMVVRPGNLFGSMQNKSKFIPYVIEQLKKGCPLNVSPCEQRRDFIYIDDFSYLMKRLLCNYDSCIGKIINVSSGDSISLKEIIENCKSEIASSSTINYGALPYRENEVMDLKCDITLLSEIIGEKKRYNIKDRLKELI